MKVGKPHIDKIDGAAHIVFPVLELLPARQLVARIGTKKAEVFELTVSSAKKKRSLDQNELMWRLCQMIAEAIGATKDEVYREHIHDYGDWIPAQVARSASAELARQWQSNGVGWIAEVISEKGDVAELRLYAGSSTYSTGQMTRLIEALMADCKALGIEPDERLASLYAER